MKQLIWIILFLSGSITGFGQTYYRMNSTTNGQTISLSCPITNTNFADDGAGSTHYSNNTDYTLTFCAPAGKLLKFDFGCGSNLTVERIHPSDTLFIYNGSSTAAPLLYKVTGNSANSNRLPYFGETSSFSFLSPGTCITFRFKTDAANNEDGWDACISCVDPVTCGANEPPSDLFAGAPSICNLNGYCGTTSNQFGADFPVNLNRNGGNCPSTLNFLGTVENNSWLKFVASANTAVFDFEVPLGGACINGIQTAVFFYSGTNLTRMSPCDLSDGSHAGTFQLTAAGLTIGETYYLMIDGNAGDVCNYTIRANDGIAVLNAGPDQLCGAGSSINVSATGPPGATYVWNSLDGIVSNQIGANQTFTPLVATTYVLAVSGGASCVNQTDTLLVTSCSTLPVQLTSFSGSCLPDRNQLVWTTASERNSRHFGLERWNDELGTFEFLADIPAEGNSSVAQAYTYDDPEIGDGERIYQLRLHDMDGTSTVLAQTFVATTCRDETTPQLLQKHGKWYLSIRGDNPTATCVFTDLQGKIIHEQNIQQDEATPLTLLETSALGSGIYYLRVSASNQHIVQKIWLE